MIAAALLAAAVALGAGAADSAPRADRPGLADTVVALQNAGVAAARAGDFELAVERLEEAHRLSMGHAAVRDNLAQALLGLGDRRRRAGDLDGAMRVLDRSLRLRPDHVEARRLLGRVLIDLDDFGGAVVHLRRAQDLVPDERTAALLARTETDAEAVRGGIVLPTPRLRVVAHPDVLPAAQRAVIDLEAALDAAERVVGRPPRRPISVVVYGPGAFGLSGAPDWAAGLYDGKVRLRADEIGAPASLRRTAAHEFSHALLEQAAPGRFPVWIHEGVSILAAEESRSPFDPPPALAASAAARAAGRRAERDGRWVPLADLDAAFARATEVADTTGRGLSGRPPSGDPFARWTPEPDVALLYAEAEIFVRHVREAYGPARLADLIAAVAAGADPLRALEEATLRTVAQVDEEVRRSL